MNVCDIQASLEEERRSLLNHPLYEQLIDVDSLRIFMEHHVWAVYDFMCMAKRLVKRLHDNQLPVETTGFQSLQG